MLKGNRLTILILGKRGTRVKQLITSGQFLSLSCFLLLLLLSISGFIILDYSRLKFAEPRDKNLEKIVFQQQDDIENQKRQIELFAEKINRIKSELAVLDEFEQKIKIVANLEETDNQEEVFGVGGSLPEDIDTKGVVASGHNALLREMHDQMNQLETASEYHRGSFEYLLDRLRDRENLLAATPTILPTDGWFSSRFGYRKSPFTGKKEFHKGLDIAAHKGTDILATADGIVTFSGRKGLMGNMVIIDHGHGMVTRYAHIHKTLKTRGATVKRGDVIALVGNTGRSTGSHLHYEVMLNGIQVNPEKYILK
jgi:murein DD-endopeptidase MepM/ murein hydrolase activator NlpD